MGNNNLNFIGVTEGCVHCRNFVLATLDHLSLLAEKVFGILTYSVSRL